MHMTSLKTNFKAICGAFGKVSVPITFRRVIAFIVDIATELVIVPSNTIHKFKIRRVDSEQMHLINRLLFVYQAYW